MRLAALALAAVALLLQVTVSMAADWPPDSFVVLCFHDIRDDARTRPDSYTLETSRLALQFEWLRSQGYHVIRLDDVLAARAGTRPLPPRAVLLTFDDGLESVYTRAFPLLQAFGYPAVVALVGSWLEEGEAAARVAPRYGNQTLGRADFLRQPQIDAMRRSGLIEFASHSYGLHEGIAANPQGNLEPAAVVRRYDAASGAYEDAAGYAARIEADLAKNSERIAALTGARPRLIVWPYGAHTRITDGIAAQLGMSTGMSVEFGVNTPDVPLSHLRRMLITRDFTTADLARVLEGPQLRAPLRAAAVSLDALYDADPSRQEENLSRLLDWVKAAGVNAVLLRAWSQPDHGAAAATTELYFPNRRLPLRADLLNRVAWQLHTRTNAAVYVSLPGLPGLGADANADIFDDLSAAVAFQGLVSDADHSLIARVAADHDGLLVVRPAGNADLQGVLQDADYVTIQASGRDGVRRVAQAAALPQGIAKEVFLVPADASLVAQLRALRRAGARNLGIGEDAWTGHGPGLDALRRVFSLQSSPGEN